MSRRVPLAWLQLSREKLRLAAAIAGVTFGVVLIFVQLGFQEALFTSSVRYHTTLSYDLAIVSPKTDFIVQPVSFPRTRLFQVAGFPEVESVTPVYLGQARWRNPFSPRETRGIFVVGFDPADTGFAHLELGDLISDIRIPDRVLYDLASRPEYGPIAEAFEREGPLSVEVNDRKIEVVGLFKLGTSFGIDGSVLTSDLNFRRIFPDRPASHIDIGLIQLSEGADPDAVRDAIAAAIPGDVEVLTRAGFVQKELDYWNSSTPIGFVFSFGVVMGLVVGMIIVYQILFSDVQDSLREYATLKAMGYTHGFLVAVVMREAALLAMLGYVPAILVTWLIYSQAAAATHLPIAFSIERIIGVFALTIFMCCASAMLAIRKLKSAEPADIY
jgi:putative ABC transport system permease protein